MRHPATLLPSLPLVTLLIAALLPALATSAPPPPPPSPALSPASDSLQTDPAIHSGTLPNGLRYLVRRNTEPKDRASLRLVVLAGSLHETDAQRGLAHFLEHMAFNGSTHYPPGTLVEFFQRMGMGFGGDTNAYTSFDHTAYMLELPDTKPATLTEGLRVFGDYAGGLLLDTSEIDRERGVILAEKRTRDSADYRCSIAGYDFLFAGTLLPKRLPIGEESVIKNATRADFLDFYNTWYRPERLALIAVGDFDPEAVVAAIKNDKNLAILAARAPARPAPDMGELATALPPPPPRVQDNTPAVARHHEPDASATTVSINTLRPWTHEPDTAQKRLRELPRLLATAMLNRRLETLAKAENAPFSRASVSIGEDFDFFHIAALQLTTTPARWTDALAVGENELRRALQFGFREHELREARANFLNTLEQSVKTAPTRRSDERAAELIDSVVNRLIPTTPEADLALYSPALAALTVDDCLAALRADFASPGGTHVFVSGNTHIDNDAVILDAYAKAAAIPVTAPADTAAAAFAYTDFGPAGQVTERRHIGDLDLTLVTFANGVRLNLKRTDFQADEILVRARVGTGRLETPRTQPGLDLYASLTFTAGGLGKHSADDLRTLLAGRNAGVGFSVADDAFILNGATTPADLVLQLQLLAAHVSDPGYRPEAARLAEKNIEQLYNRLDHSPAGPLQTTVARLLASGDPRFGLPARSELAQRTLAETRVWLAPQFATGPIEIALVGDLDIDTAINAVAATLGALPARAPRPALDDARLVSIPATPATETYTVPTTIPKGITALYWPTTDALDVSRTRRLNLLADILTDRLRKVVREQIGGAYSPAAGSVPSETYPGYGFLVTQITIDPERAADIQAAVVRIAQQLHDEGVTDDEIIRARLPVLTALRESARTNGYWLNTVLGAAQEQPRRLDWARTRLSDYESITKADIDALSRAYLAPARAFKFTIVPAP
ncbi:M16 family metallopeptidase [Geminisphaera colitermitum]|uniref:M16 family metallopeptidase n=1 Tax=Geminisphaera colitermitum TaxID=1148786 RepID=UPI000693A6FB|nr:insulinase family protein [Geminisphaera colitermitum]